MRHYSLPPLDQLEAFEASARHLSFTKAADELCLTQSAVSRQIAALEEYHKLPLFLRLHRGLRLTEEGQYLFGAVGHVLSRLHEASAHLRRERKRTVVITTTPGFAGLWLIPRLARFTASRPDVHVRISAHHDLTNLDRDGVDLAIRYGNTAQPDPAALLCLRERVFPVCSPALARNADRPLQSPSDLQRHTLLQKDTESVGSYHHWSTWLRAVKLDHLQPANTLRFSMYDQMIQAAVDGQGIALGHSPLVDELVRQGKLVVPFAVVVESPRGYLVLPSGMGLQKPEVQEFVDWLRSEMVRDAEAAVPMPDAA